MSTGELLSIEPQELHFPFELNKQISCSLQLSNKTDYYVAFKVKTTNPKKYCVRPNIEVVLPRSTCDVIVTMQAQKEAPNMQCKDKFLVQSVFASPGATPKDITQEMFNKEAGHNVEECKLRVLYVAPPRPLSPVREGSLQKADCLDVELIYDELRRTIPKADSKFNVLIRHEIKKMFDNVCEFIPSTSLVNESPNNVDKSVLALPSPKIKNPKAEKLKVKAGISKKKKKKPRRSGIRKNSSNNENLQNCLSHETEVEEVTGLPPIEGNERKSLLSFIDHVDGYVDESRICKLLLSKEEIARGSNGTIVYEGVYADFPVAVKRLLKTHHDLVLKEMKILAASGQHQNIVRWYTVEHDREFFYLVLERCNCNLNDLINDNNKNVELRKFKNVELRMANGYPSPLSLKLLRDMVSGVAHLHERRIMHRDLKPQNVLIVKDGSSLCAKISDMGISKRLPDDISSLTQNVTGCGSSGWQAPEQLLHNSQTLAADSFSLGLVLFFCISGGKHPFGEKFERDANIVKNQKVLFLVDVMPEAEDLISQLLDPNPDMRLKVQDAKLHRLLWTSEKKLAFFKMASDQVELAGRKNQSQLLNDLESIASKVFEGEWDKKMDPACITNTDKKRKEKNIRAYKYQSVRDLLRFIRNELTHYYELPPEIQELLGQGPEGGVGYFLSRFPKLLFEVYELLYQYWKEKDFFKEYKKSTL